MSNLDDSIGKILLDLQKDDPDTFKKLMKKAQVENPELFENSIDAENTEIDEYHGFVNCQYCHNPISHNIKTNNEFKIVYVKCMCRR